MIIRQATLEDVRRWKDQTGQDYGFSLRAYTAEHDGKLMGLAGVYYQDRFTPVAFSEMLPEMKKFKKDIVRITRLVMRLIDKRAIPAYALCGTESGYAFCKKLGFVEFANTEAGRVMKWQP